jgi:hypothetical protein
MHHRLAGLVTIMAIAGPDVDRSAAARHTSEVIWAPAAALAPQIRWRTVDHTRVTILIPCGQWVFEPTLTVSSTGVLSQVTVPRWTNLGGTAWHEEPFTAVLGSERTFGGYTVPARATAGWGHGSERWEHGGAFIRLLVDDATYR